MSNQQWPPSLNRNVSSAENRDTIDPDALPGTRLAKIVKRKDILLVSADHLQQLLSTMLNFLASPAPSFNF